MGKVGKPDLEANPIATDLEIKAQVTGDIIYFNGTNWVRLQLGTANQVLGVLGGIPSWSSRAALKDLINVFTADQEIGLNKLKTNNYSISELTGFPNLSTGLSVKTLNLNAFTQLGIVPDGTATNSWLAISRLSTLSGINFEMLRLGSDFQIAGEYFITFGEGGTGIARPLNIYRNTTKLMSFDTDNIPKFHKTITLVSSGVELKLQFDDAFTFIKRDHITGNFIINAQSAVPIQLFIGTTEQARLSEPADGNTALLIRRNVAGALSLQQVSMGAVDSGGAGFKVLRVPN